MNRRLLVADSDETLADVYRKYSSRYGCAVDTASASGADAMLLDTEMPDGDGLDVPRRVKSAKPCLVILMHSHCDSPRIQDRAHELGASGYLTHRAGADEVMPFARRP